MRTVVTSSVVHFQRWGEYEQQPARQDGNVDDGVQRVGHDGFLFL